MEGEFVSWKRPQLTDVLHMQVTGDGDGHDDDYGDGDGKSYGL